MAYYRHLTFVVFQHSRRRISVLQDLQRVAHNCC